MSLDHVWPQVRALRSEAAADSELEWKILYPFRSRMLLVPTAAPDAARAAVALFVDNRLLRGLGYVLLWLDETLAGRVLPTARLEEFPVALLFGPSAGQRLPYAAQFGSPGPLSKLAVFSPGPGDAGQLAKIALDASADQSVHREAYWLRTLGATPAAPFLPRLLRHGVLPCGRAFITIDVLPRGASTRRFSPRHREFLARLAAQSRSAARWSAPAAAEQLRQRLAAIAGLLDPAFRRTSDAALAEIERRMPRRTVPACLVHGDFAAWNLRVAGGRLYVFDWEYAEANGNPLQDFLHFHLIDRATRRGAVACAYMRALLARAARYGSGVFGPDGGVAEAAPALALHYLIDLLTFYVEASRRFDREHAVVKAYLHLLDERASWLPASPAGGVAHA